jgi:hypothetical protein
MATRESVKITNGALEEAPDGSIILRGTIAMDSLHSLKVDDYQREVLSSSGSGGRNSSKIRKGIEAGARLPTIELGMRGQDFTSSGRTFTLHDPVYIVDGLQRVSAMKQYLEAHDGKVNGALPIAAEVHFKTTKEVEKERFATLNGNMRTPVSPNILLRNIARGRNNPALTTLYGLSNSDKAFALYERVCWNQRMKQTELLSAMSIVKAVLNLHRHTVEQTKEGKGTGGHKNQRMGTNIANKHQAVPVLDRVAREIGLQTFRDNIKEFFNLIDECYGIRSIEYGEAQGHLRSNFLTVLGSFIANNPQLWKDEDQHSMQIDKATRDRFKTFKVNDPEIRRLSAAGTMVIPTLYQHLLIHMNKHKSKNKFK